MEKLSNAEILLADFGTSIGIEELSFNDENRCNLLFDEIAITIELLEDTETVYIYSYLCQIRDDEQTEVQSLLLHANYLFNDTSGSTLGMELGTKKIALIKEIKCSTTMLLEFQSIVDEFINLAEKWTAIIIDFGKKNQSDIQPYTIESSNFTRV